VPREIIIETLYQCYQILADAKANHREKLAASRMIDRLVRSYQTEDMLGLEKASTVQPDVADARAAQLPDALTIVLEHRRVGADP
jgi:hypothetical protein